MERGGAGQESTDQERTAASQIERAKTKEQDPASGLNDIGHPLASDQANLKRLSSQDASISKYKTENTIAPENNPVRLAAQQRNQLEGIQFKAPDQSMITINPTSDSKYPEGSQYISRSYPDGKKDVTMIVDKNGTILNENNRQSFRLPKGLTPSVTN